MPALTLLFLLYSSTTIGNQSVFGPGNPLSIEITLIINEWFGIIICKELPLRACDHFSLIKLRVVYHLNVQIIVGWDGVKVLPPIFFPEVILFMVLLVKMNGDQSAIKEYSKKYNTEFRYVVYLRRE